MKYVMHCIVWVGFAHLIGKLGTDGSVAVILGGAFITTCMT